MARGERVAGLGERVNGLSKEKQQLIDTDITIVITGRKRVAEGEEG